MLEHAEPEAVPEIAPATPRRLGIAAPVSPTTGWLALQRAAGNRAVGRLLHRQAGAAAAPGELRGDAARPTIEADLAAFKTAKEADKVEIGKRAVWAVIRAYGLVTTGLAEVGVTLVSSRPGVMATTDRLNDAGRRSKMTFNPNAFSASYETFVAVVAHELEHVRQHLIGEYRADMTAHTPEYPVAEFLGYATMLLQGEPTSIPSRSVLPALSTNDLMEPAMHALASWRRMTDAERRRYWPQFERIRDRLFERLRNEAPALLRPPGALPGSPEFETWRGQDGPAPAPPSTYDPLSPDYNPERADAASSPWIAVKKLWRDLATFAPMVAVDVGQSRSKDVRVDGSIRAKGGGYDYEGTRVSHPSTLGADATSDGCGWIRRAVPAFAFTAGGVSRTAVHFAFYGLVDRVGQRFANVHFAPDNSSIPAPGFQQATPLSSSSITLRATALDSVWDDVNGARWIRFKLTGTFDPSGPGRVSFSGIVRVNAIGHSYLESFDLVDDSGGFLGFGPRPTVTVSPLPGWDYRGRPTIRHGLWIDIEPWAHTSSGGPKPPGGGPCTDPEPVPAAPL
jgi:hypothetical protein